MSHDHVWREPVPVLRHVCRHQWIRRTCPCGKGLRYEIAETDEYVELEPRPDHLLVAYHTGPHTRAFDYLVSRVAANLMALLVEGAREFGWVGGPNAGMWGRIPHRTETDLGSMAVPGSERVN